LTRVAFATCVRLGLSCIEEIFEIGGGLELLITLRDERARDKSGRIFLDDIAREHHVPLLKINNINDAEVLESLQRHRIDWLFIIGWSQIAKPALLAAPTYGCIGMHPTLLPEGRGRAAIPWAILKGLSRTGVTLFRMDEGVDTGDIIGQGVIELDDTMTAMELYRRVGNMHVELIRKYWPDIVGNQATLTKQNEAEATEWPGRRPEDGEIFGSMTMCEADRMVRAVTHPYPGAFYRDGDRTIRIWSCAVSGTGGEIKLTDGFMTPTEFEVEYGE
jgi:methionyl-tRNA formyltransferase